MATTHDANKQDTTSQDEVRQEIEREIIERLGGLSEGQLYEVLELMKIMGTARSEDNPDLATRMQRLRDDLQITDEEFAELDRILREHDDAEKRRLEQLARE